jgi:very-short-patch-repair endonuclease
MRPTGAPSAIGQLPRNVGGGCHASGMPRSSDFDRAAVTAVLARQYQVITRSQVIGCGLSESALVHRLRAGGPWQRLLPGVFLTVSGTPTSDQRDLAALLYAGPGSMLTGTAALRLWGVRAPATSLIDVLVSTSKQRKSAGFVRIQLTTRMPEQVLTTGPRRFAPLPRAVGDTARSLGRLTDVRALVAAVVQQGKCTPAELAAELEQGPVQGSALLRIAIDDVYVGTRSSPEADLNDLLRRTKLPMPEFNPQLYVGEEFIASPDAWWRHAGVAAEVDSHQYHLSPEDHERTLARDARMKALGINVLHFTPRQIRTQPAQVIAAIRFALAGPVFQPPVPIRTISIAAAPHPDRGSIPPGTK